MWRPRQTGQNSDTQGRAWAKQGRAKAKNDDTMLTMLHFLVIARHLTLVKVNLSKYLFHPPLMISHLSNNPYI